MLQRWMMDAQLCEQLYISRMGKQIVYFAILCNEPQIKVEELNKENNGCTE